MDNYTIRLFTPDNDYEDIDVSHDTVGRLMNGLYKPKPDSGFDCFKVSRNGEHYWSGILKHYHDREEIRAYVWVEENDGYVVKCSSHRLYSPLNFEWKSTFRSPVPVETLEEIKEKAEIYISQQRKFAKEWFKKDTK